MPLPRDKAALLNETEQLARFQASGAAADLLPIYQAHAAFIYALALRYLGTPERAEDAGAEIWGVLLEKLPKHEVSNFKSWLHTLVRNHCLMQLRRERRDPLANTAAPLMQSDALLHLGEEPTERDTDTRPLHHCIKQLKEEQRHCIHLFYLQEGHTYLSIAEKLNLTVGRVRSHLQNGRRNLKICLEAQTQSDQ